jgi:hypothetical protein
LAGMGRGNIDDRSVSAIGAKVSFRAQAVHEKATAMARWGVRFGRTVGERNLRTR